MFPYLPHMSLFIGLPNTSFLPFPVMLLFIEILPVPTLPVPTLLYLPSCTYPSCTYPPVPTLPVPTFLYLPFLYLPSCTYPSCTYPSSSSSSNSGPSLSHFPFSIIVFFCRHSFGILGMKEFSVFWPTPSLFCTGNSEEGIEMFAAKDFRPLRCNASLICARFPTFRKSYSFIRFFIIIRYIRSHSIVNETSDRAGC